VREKRRDVRAQYNTAREQLLSLQVCALLYCVPCVHSLYTCTHAQAEQAMLYNAQLGGSGGALDDERMSPRGARDESGGARTSVSAVGVSPMRVALSDSVCAELRAEQRVIGVYDEHRPKRPRTACVRAHSATTARRRAVSTAHRDLPLLLLL
jgi:hypothetical protein